MSQTKSRAAPRFLPWRLGQWTWLLVACVPQPKVYLIGKKSAERDSERLRGRCPRATERLARVAPGVRRTGLRLGGRADGARLLECGGGYWEHRGRERFHNEAADAGEGGKSAQEL